MGMAMQHVRAAPQFRQERNPIVAQEYFHRFSMQAVPDLKYVINAFETGLILRCPLKQLIRLLYVMKHVLVISTQ